MKQALILAAGRGARLDRPNTPKPLVEVGGQPMIVRLINQLKQQNVERIHIAVGYESKRIMHALSSYFGYETGLAFHKVEDWQKGSARSILAARKWIPGNFILAMADHVFDDSLIAEITNAAPGANEVLAMVDNRPIPPQIFKTALKVRQTEWGSIEDVGVSLTDATGIDAGLFAASNVLFDVLSTLTRHGRKGELMDGLRVLARTESLCARLISDANWFDVDTPADVIRAEMHLRKIKREHSVRPVARDPQVPMSAGMDYRLKTDHCTQMIVQNGLVESPEKYNIIPRQSASSPVFLFTDETVSTLYGQAFAARLREQGYDIHSIVLPDGEESKTISNYVYLVERVLSRGVDERSVFISLGGGVVCNVCGFVASTIYRGLSLIHIPTTLMAQGDAAISHKQAINGHFGKNMVGAYYPPDKVIIDINVLKTLYKRQIQDGFAEIVKHALGQDPSLAEYLLSYGDDICSLPFLDYVIQRNIALKCELVREDPRELNDAMVLQYGHTAGHPLEHLSGYALYHGEAVAMGMMVAVRVARHLGACDDRLVHLHMELLQKFGLPTEIPREIEVSDFIDALRFNKRHLMEGSQMVLLQDIGRLWKVDGNTAIPVCENVIRKAFLETQNSQCSLEFWSRSDSRTDAFHHTAAQWNAVGS
ncbi:MAG: iron-containing alcohol dehydrogenase [Deltaproteobacteria bacterium]|nr:iron-containing alcohol dehydrogenase [Deltaproteobacteria bacterium]